MISVSELSQRILEGASNPLFADLHARKHKYLRRPLTRDACGPRAGIKDNPSAPEGDRPNSCQKIALTPLDDVGKAEL